MRSTRMMVLSALFASTLAACGGGDDDEAAPTSPPAPAPAPSPSPGPSPSPSPAPAPAPGVAPAPSPVPTAGAASECFNAAFSTVGTTWNLDYQVSGALTGTSNSVNVVKPRTTFNGVANLLEIESTITTRYTAPALQAAVGAVTVTNSVFEDIVGTDFIYYGSRQSASAGGFTIATTNVNNPAVRDSQYSLGVGQSLTLTQNTVTSISGTPIAVPDVTTTTTYTITYDGQESITVPAGTFTACKFRRTDSNGTSTNWMAKGSGAPVRSLSADGNGVQAVLELLASSRVNGSPIPAN